MTKLPDVLIVPLLPSPAPVVSGVLVTSQHDQSAPSLARAAETESCFSAVTKFQQTRKRKMLVFCVSFKSPRERMFLQHRREI